MIAACSALSTSQQTRHWQVLWVLTTLAMHVPVLAEAPKLSWPRPLAVRPGAAVELTLRGEHLQGAQKLWTSFPATTSLLGQKPNTAKEVSFLVSVAEEVPVGLAALRTLTPAGLSNAHLVLIDDLPSVAEVPGNKSPARAQPIVYPCAVDGSYERETWDFFRFRGRQGQQISVEVIAGRMGSPLDPVLRLLDATGRRELAYADDSPGLGRDAWLRYRLPADGDYLLEVRDIRYSGSKEHRFRLRLGDFPLVSRTDPVTLQRGQQSSVSFSGPEAETIGHRQVAAPADDSPRLRISLRREGGESAAMVRAWVAEVADTPEVECNDTLPSATPVEIPGGLCGAFQKARDKDLYRILGKKGQKYIIRGQTRQLDSPADLVLRLFDAQGKQLISVDDVKGAEGWLAYRFPADGTYYLEVTDLAALGGPGRIYRVAIEPEQASFALSVTQPDKQKTPTDAVQVPQGGRFQLLVHALRHQTQGPIRLSVEGLPARVKLAGQIIPPNKSQTQLTVSVPESLKPGSVYLFRIVGHATSGDRQVSAVATTTALSKMHAGVRFPPQELLFEIGLGILAK